MNAAMDLCADEITPEEITVEFGGLGGDGVEICIGPLHLVVAYESAKRLWTELNPYFTLASETENA